MLMLIYYFYYILTTHQLTKIDRIISTKVLDLNKDPQPYDVVKQFMVHSPCSSLNPNSSHMIGNKCRKHFQKNITLKLQLTKMIFQYIEKETTEDLLTKMISNLTITL
jgi:hypothetical protein